jgi:hypothetical protein
MPAGPHRKDIAALPLFGQALVACRLARRAAMAMVASEDRGVVLAACDEIDTIIRTGGGWRGSHPAMDAARAMPRTHGTRAALEGVRWAFDSAGAAEGANDFPVDAIVTSSATRCIEAVSEDARVGPVQVSILINSDIDSIAFACHEAHVHTYDPLGAGVFARLAPCHPLTLVEPGRDPEEEHR